MKDEPVDLKIRTKKFALRVIKMYSSLPKSTTAQILGKQVLRSGTSVGANFREAYRARSEAEFISILGICLKELEETLYWFELLVESNILPVEKLSSLMDECNQLIAILTYIAKGKKRKVHTS
jgi:four helix bundle protein